jgi:hypothetical protein
MRCAAQAAERSLAELKEFAAQLKALPHIQRHIGLAEAVNRAIAAPAFRARVALEQQLLDGHGVDAAAEAIEVGCFLDAVMNIYGSMMCQGACAQDAREGEDRP